jgi:phage tail-like protein
MTSEPQPGRLSSYLDYLPAIFQAEPAEQPAFLGRFLLAFEKILSGLGDVNEPGLEEILDGIVDHNGQTQLAGIERYFDPGVNPDNSLAEEQQRAPTEFLDWLAGWVALTLRADLDEDRRRRLIARVVPLYKLRGTRAGLSQMIQIYTSLPPTITEPAPDGEQVHFFAVQIRLATPEPSVIAGQRRLVQAIIDQEKPAHTYYSLEVITPSLQIGTTSTIGVDTLLGAGPE